MAKTIQVVTYNILYESEKEIIWNNITKCIEKGVTVFCLQEVTQETATYFASQLQKLKPQWHIHAFIPKDMHFGSAIIWGNILHKKSIHDIILPRCEGLTVWERFFSLLNSTKNPIVNRSMVLGEFILDNKSLTIVSLHLDHIGGLKNRTRQLRYAVEQMKSNTPDHSAILCGDFNTYDLLRTGKEYKENCKTLSGFSDATKNVTWTHDINRISYYGKLTLFKSLIRLFNMHWHKHLDYIWFMGATASKAKRLDLPGSDHLPVLAEIEL